jgi:hypothetical protein
MVSSSGNGYGIAHIQGEHRKISSLRLNSAQRIEIMRESNEIK